MKWLTKMFHMRTQKSMILWSKRQYHEAFDQLHLDQAAFTNDPPTIASDITRVQTWEAILYYLTGDDQWLDSN